MKLPIALTTLFLAATTAVPAFAHAPTGHSFYEHGGVAQYTRERAAGPIESRRVYRNGYGAYAAAPGAAVVRRPLANGWGHCVSGGASEFYSAYPSWDVCP
jgi:hypothetical protein